MGKRWLTLPDRRVLAIVISEAVARSWGIASQYSFAFQYQYDSELNQLVFDYDHNQFGMTWRPPLVVGAPQDGRDLAVPAIFTGIASGVDTLICTIIWGAKLRRTSNLVVGMGLFELSVVTAAGFNVRIDPSVFSWRFDAS